MFATFLEIVELPDGRIALRRAEDEHTLVELNFSDDAKHLMHGQHIEVAKAMLSVGAEVAGELAENNFVDDGKRVLH